MMPVGIQYQLFLTKSEKAMSISVIWGSWTSSSTKICLNLGTMKVMMPQRMPPATVMTATG